MQTVSNDNSGPPVAYLVPGATVLLGLRPYFPVLHSKLHLRRKLLFCEDSGGVDQEFRPDPSADARLPADPGGEWAQPACKGRRLPVVSFNLTTIRQ